MCSVRYALGRQTYLIGSLCDIIRSQKHLSDKCLNGIIKDIERAINDKKSLGGDCDKKNWLNLLKWCKDKLGKQNKV